MSRWFVNDAWPDFYPPDTGPITFVDCADVAGDLVIDASDALADPEVETLLDAGLALWPRGAAWGSPDGEAVAGDSVIAKLTRALLSPFADLYRRAWRLSLESRSASLVDSLDDWETEFGLPDRCATEPQTVEQRRANLRAKVARLATITPADIVRLAARIGFTVAVEEPEALRAGESELGWLGEVSDTALEQQFTVHIFDLPVTQFEAGISETGVDRLLDFDIGVLACAVRRVAPAWTYPAFSIAPFTVPYLLVTEDGAPVVTETGAGLIVPLAA